MNESVIFAESIEAMSLARNDNNLLTKSFSQSQILKNNNLPAAITKHTATPIMKNQNKNNQLSTKV